MHPIRKLFLTFVSLQNIPSEVEMNKTKIPKIPEKIPVTIIKSNITKIEIFL